uniref:Uncharacterized protein n=1 Tax=Arundo donax TaxID=35708 RepID=A0A0A9G4V7_ARUDO
MFKSFLHSGLLYRGQALHAILFSPISFFMPYLCIR